MVMAPPSDGDLRIRYLDWCSAKVVERFQELSLDEIWERAQRAGRSRQPQASRSPASPSPLSPLDNPGYLELVRLLSVQLADELGLPPFETWAEQYRRDPGGFEREMLGLGDRPILEEPSY